MINIAVMGHGTVGSGVVEVFYKNREKIQNKVGKQMDIKYILDLREFPDSPYADKFTKDFNLIAEDPDIEIVAEVMGGLEPAFTYVKTCLSKGKSVVTSNKELVAARGAELLEIARQNGVNFYFEASVGGGIPVIRPLYACMGTDEIHEIAGILNGTTNFILTKMIREQMSFDDALKIAQDLGYAERNPSADVDGHDACRKICILAALASGHHVYPEFVHTEGIRSITPEDVAYAENWGGVIKLIGRAKMLPGSDDIHAMVSPAFVPGSSQLASIDDVFNGILVRADATGDVVFYGRGAGKLPTASAVIADIVTAAKEHTNDRAVQWIDDGKNHVLDYKQDTVSMYMRVQGTGETLVLAKELFGDIKVLSREAQPENEFAFVTSLMKEADIDCAAQKLQQSGCTVLGSVRVLNY